MSDRTRAHVRRAATAPIVLMLLGLAGCSPSHSDRAEGLTPPAATRSTAPAADSAPSSPTTTDVEPGWRVEQTTVAASRAIIATGSAEDVCDAAASALDRNEGTLQALVIADVDLRSFGPTFGAPGRWLFCRGECGGSVGTLSVRSSDERSWSVTALDLHLGCHAGDEASARVLNAQRAEMTGDSLLNQGHPHTHAWTDDGGTTWLVASWALS